MAFKIWFWIYKVGRKEQYKVGRSVSVQDTFAVILMFSSKNMVNAVNQVQNKVNGNVVCFRTYGGTSWSSAQSTSPVERVLSTLNIVNLLH